MGFARLLPYPQTFRFTFINPYTKIISRKKIAKFLFLEQAAASLDIAFLFQVLAQIPVKMSLCLGTF